MVNSAKDGSASGGDDDFGKRERGKIAEELRRIFSRTPDYKESFIRQAVYVQRLIQEARLDECKQINKLGIKLLKEFK